MQVKIRKEGAEFLVYFIDSRRIVGVNEVGAFILDLLLNRGYRLSEITSNVAAKYGISSVRAEGDILGFLSAIKGEIERDGFSLLKQRQLTAPLGVELEITLACNLRCLHCLQGDHPEIYMPTNKVCEVLTTLADNDVFEISLIGGEPFKHPGISQILDCCQERDLAVNIVTNGTLLTDALLTKLASYNRLTLLVSLDGMQEQHDQIRGQGTFTRVDMVLRNLTERKIQVEVMCTLNAINLDHYREVVAYCDSLGVPCNFNLFKPFRPEHRSLIPDPRRFFDVIRDLYRMRRDGKYMIGLSNAAIVSDLMGISPRNECRATLSGLVVNVHGKMLACPTLLSAGYYRGSELPRFNKHFLSTWRKHPHFVRFRENGFRECQARAFIFSNDIRGIDPYGVTAFKRSKATISES